MRWSGLIAVILVGAACSDSGGGGPVGPCPTGQDKFDMVCVNHPTLEVERTPCGDVTEFCDPLAMKTPSLACLTTKPAGAPATPATVRLTGFIHPFSGGNSNDTVTIQVFRAADLGAADPSTATPLASVTVGFNPATATDPTQFRACDLDPRVGCVAVDPSACTAPICNDGLAGRADNNMYCHRENGQPTCSHRLRWEPRFSVDGVPTNTPLAIRSFGANGPDVWGTIVQWNVYLSTADKSCGGDAQATDCLDTSDMAHPKYQLNANVISQADYTNIPVTAGLAAGISPNEGAVAGEVHDCDNVRLTNVQVGLSPAGDKLTYFNGNPYDTLPDPSRVDQGSDRLGLYSSLNVVPGAVVVEAAGLVGGKVVSLGKYNAYVYAGTVSVVNLNGGKPPQ
jgi:hypothetical protein